MTNQNGMNAFFLTLIALISMNCVHSFTPFAQHLLMRATNTQKYFQNDAPYPCEQYHQKYDSSLSQSYRYLDTKQAYSSLPYNDDAEAGNQKQAMKEVTKKVVRVKSSSAGVAENVITATTEEEYLKALSQYRDEGKLVIVRFAAKWCKTCQSITPSFNRLARRNPRIAFIDIPVTHANAELVQNKLHVAAIPTAHIHHPYISSGPVEEWKITKNQWSCFESAFHHYVKGSCTVLDCDYSNPFERSPGVF